MSRGVRRVVSVVAAIAVPFVAPVLAGSLGLTGALTSAGLSAGTAATTASALTGAALGGAASAIGGGDVLTGAGLGALGGGLSGFGAANNAAAALPEGSSLTVGPSGQFMAAPAAGAGPPVPISAIAPAVGAAGAAAPPAANMLSSAISGLTSPAALARVTMLALASDEDPNATAGLTSEERELVEQRKQELRRIAATNRELFEQQVTAARGFFQQARQQGPNPQQAFTDARISAQRQLAQSTRGLSPDQADAVRRRAAIRASTIGATAASAEERRGRAAQTQLMQAGLRSLPTSAPEGYAGLALPLYQDMAERRRQATADQGFAAGQASNALFGGIA